MDNQRNRQRTNTTTATGHPTKRSQDKQTTAENQRSYELKDNCEKHGRTTNETGKGHEQEQQTINQHN
eukprot:16443005-Heterocapsa_arctica.AAC.1